MKRSSGLFVFLIAAFALLFVSVFSLPLKADDTVGPATDKPNIIVIITDDQDGESVPVMRKLMANPYGDWIQFTDGFTVDSIGGVARVSL
ncbi:MAG: hypothetical protein R3C44_15795 [Chloroflexota bacterium]